MVTRKFQILLRYLDYFLRAVDSHSLQSPFLFQFYNTCIRDNKEDLDFEKIEEIRQRVLHDYRVVKMNDLGAGSIVSGNNKRKIKDIATSSLANQKFGRFMYRVCSNFKPKTILELGTSLGITTMYMSLGNPGSQILTFEGCPAISSIAKENFTHIDYKNIQIIQGNIDVTLAEKLIDVDNVDLVYFDANHQYTSTLNYFHLCLGKKTETSLFIFDDIHWSTQMEEAWKAIVNHQDVTLTVDIFDAGLVFFNQSLKKQHYIIKF